MSYDTINDRSVGILQRKYSLSHSLMNDYVNDILSIHNTGATARDLEGYIRSKGHTSILEMVEYNEAEEQSEAKETCNVIQFTKKGIPVDTEEIYISTNVKLPSHHYCQTYWETGQNNIVIPSRFINATKRPPMSTLIAFSLLSAKDGGDTTDGTGKGARIVNAKRFQLLSDKLTGTRDIKLSTISTHIRKLMKLKSNEFEFIKTTDENGKEKHYYKLDYSQGFVNIDIRIIHYMISNYDDPTIQAYIVLNWICRNGKYNQLTQEQLAQHLGLTKHSYRQAKTVIDKLVSDGFIKQKFQYVTESIVDLDTGIPSTVVKRHYEYKVVYLDEIEN